MRVPAWLAGLGAVIASLLAAFFAGKREGKQVVKNDLQKETAKLNERAAKEYANKPTTEDELVDRIDRL